MSIPGFDAELSLGPTMSTYRLKPVLGSPAEASGRVMPQLGFGGDPDWGDYWRCRTNGGSDLICRFFGGFAPFTIGRFFAR
jgi:hypothetical protein